MTTQTPDFAPWRCYPGAYRTRDRSTQDLHHSSHLGRRLGSRLERVLLVRSRQSRRVQRPVRALVSYGASCSATSEPSLCGPWMKLSAPCSTLPPTHAQFLCSWEP